MLAVLAGEGDSYSNVSAGHIEKVLVVEWKRAAMGEEKPRPSARYRAV
jgi:hypothetical protein